jgi:hypothetical protein
VVTLYFSNTNAIYTRKWTRVINSGGNWNASAWTQEQATIAAETANKTSILLRPAIAGDPPPSRDVSYFGQDLGNINSANAPGGVADLKAICAALPRPGFYTFEIDPTITGGRPNTSNIDPSWWLECQLRIHTNNDKLYCVITAREFYSNRMYNISCAADTWGAWSEILKGDVDGWLPRDAYPNANGATSIIGTYNGNPIIRRCYKGTTNDNSGGSVTATPAITINALFRLTGFVTGSDGSVHPINENGTNNVVRAYFNSSGNLVITATGPLNRPYTIWVEYA